MEIYNDEKEHTKEEDKNRNAFQKIVNAKFKDITQQSEYPTVEFSTQSYYNESIRLTKDPISYMGEKINPIYRHVPIKKDYGKHLSHICSPSNL